MNDRFARFKVMCMIEKMFIDYMLDNSHLPQHCLSIGISLVSDGRLIQLNRNAQKYGCSRSTLGIATNSHQVVNSSLRSELTSNVSLRFRIPTH